MSMQPDMNQKTEIINSVVGWLTVLLLEDIITLGYRSLIFIVLNQVNYITYKRKKRLDNFPTKNFLCIFGVNR